MVNFMRQTAKFKQGFSLFYQRFGTLPFLIILIGIQLYLWTNGPALFPNWNNSYGQLIEVYMVMTLIFLVFSYRQSRLKKEIYKPMWMAARAFSLAFIATWAILECFYLFGWLHINESFDMSLIWQTILIQVCVVAVCEELMFRGVLLQGLEFYFKSAIVAIIGSSIIFAIWHLYAYQIILYEETWASFNWMALFMAFTIGIILCLVTRAPKWGLAASIGIHACWNVFVQGGLNI